MKSYTEYLWLETQRKREYINITEAVAEIVEKSGIQEGLALVSSTHLTCGVYINDADEGFLQDLDEWLEKLAPASHHYKHHDTGGQNADAHLKNILVGQEVIVPITGGRLDLGTWQQIFYAEFDGQRRKRVVIKIFGL